MAIGVQYDIRLHEDATGVIVFDSLTRKEFTHDAAFVAPVTTVKFEDYPGAHLDSFEVKTSYPFGGEPDKAATTIDDVISAAVVVIDAAIRAGTSGGGAPSVNPSFVA